MSVSGAPHAVDGVAVSGSQVTLTLASAVTANDAMVVLEMLPRERFGPDELLLWLKESQLRNERVRRSHERRRSARRKVRPEPHPELVVVVLN